MRSLVFLTLAACGAQHTPERAPASTSTTTPSSSIAAPIPTPAGSHALDAPMTCAKNDDCVITNLNACCATCKPAPFAELAAHATTLANQCKLVECSKLREEPDCKPADPLDAFHAECHAGACVAVKNPPASRPTPAAPALLESTFACSKDADCLVTNTPTCCTTCQASAYVISTTDFARRNHLCATVDCSVDRSEPCDPIVDASRYRAVCHAGTCAGVRR